MSEVNVAMPGHPLQCLLHQEFHSHWIVIEKCQTLMPSRNCVKCIQCVIRFNCTVEYVYTAPTVPLVAYINAIVNFMDLTVLLDKMCYIAWFNCAAEHICS